MKNLFFAMFAVFFSAAALAAPYYVVGALDATEIETSGPLQGLGLTYVPDPEMPLLDGRWNLDYSTNTFNGTIHYSPFSAWNYTWDNGQIMGGALTNNPSVNLGLSGESATFTFNPLFRKLTIRNAVLNDIGSESVCVMAFGYSSCEPPPPEVTPDYGVDNFTLELFFDETYQSFSGKGVDLRTYFNGQLTYKSVYTFIGTAVPVPGAVWLLGSGLIGLGLAARRRAAG